MPFQDCEFTTHRPAAAARMRHLRKAQLAGTGEHGLTLDCGSGTTCHLVAVSDEVVRVLFLQGSAPREPKSWMVLGAPPAVINCTERTAAPAQHKCGPVPHHSQPDVKMRISRGLCQNQHAATCGCDAQATDSQAHWGDRRSDGHRRASHGGAR